MPKSKIIISCILYCIYAFAVAVFSLRVDATATKVVKIRIATFNVSLQSENAGELISKLKSGDKNAYKIAEIIKIIRPDILLLNEFDYDANQEAIKIFTSKYLAKSTSSKYKVIAYPYIYAAPVNTGILSPYDLDHDGKHALPNDAWGYGQHPGQYGMVLFSKFPIDKKHVRTFQKFLWSAMPNALQPFNPDNQQPYYLKEIWEKLRLSSKSHWDVPIQTPAGTLHILVHHPTPPVFDGADDHNGLRNHDEIRFWADYIDVNQSAYIIDDKGQKGGLAASAHFVILGDHNADPNDGDSYSNAIQQLLGHSQINASFTPRSAGGVESAKQGGGENAKHLGSPAEDTGSFGPEVGNLRLDYVLPDHTIKIIDGGVFWPEKNNINAQYIDASDHRLVWLDIIIKD